MHTPNIKIEPISYRRVLVSTLLHATVYVYLHNLLNVIVQIADKMGLQIVHKCAVANILPMIIAEVLVTERTKRRS
jgi:hypothetical protein